MSFENLKGKLCVALYALCMCLTFIFLITSTPISQFKGKGIRDSGASKVTCVTVWGTKNDCGHNEYDYRPSIIACNKGKQLFQAAQAFYIIADVVSLLCCILSAVWFMGTPMKAALIVLGFCNIAFSLIPWAIMTAVWYQDYCANQGFIVNPVNGKVVGVPTGKALRDNFKTSAGYGLTIAGWCVNVVGVILIFINI